VVRVRQQGAGRLRHRCSRASLHVNQKHEIVIAKVSSQALPTDADASQLTARAVSGIMQFLAASSR